MRGAGLRVSTVKYAHHAIDLDQPGKDSFRHREAGAEEVLLVGAGRWALFRETPEGPPPLSALAARLAPVDLILVEGFRAEPFARIEIFRPALAKPPLWPDHPGIVAVATDAVLPAACPVPLLDLNDAAAIAHWIVAFMARLPPGA